MTGIAVTKPSKEACALYIVLRMIMHSFGHTDQIIGIAGSKALTLVEDVMQILCREIGNAGWVSN